MTSSSAPSVRESKDHRFDECSEVFVGGGWAGIYSLYRRATSYPDRASAMCLMEASWRIGGRTYSVPINHTTIPFVQDVGAYRFSPDMHLVGDLILHELELPTECYQTDCPSAKEDFPEPFMFNYSAPLRRIVNPTTGLPSGYATALHAMIDKVESLGARVFVQTKLVQFNLTEGNGNVQLVFEDTVSGQVAPLPSGSVDTDDGISALFLNLPRNKLLEVRGVAESLSPTTLKTIQCIVFDAPADLFGDETAAEFHDISHYTTNLGKAYLYYPNAWWRTQLHQAVGKWPPDVGFAAVITPGGVRFNVRWHDGPVSCAMDGDGVESCQGLLETYYSVSNETFYSSLPTSPDEPLGSIWDTDGPEAQATLLQAHDALVDLLDPLIQQMNLTDSKSVLTPPSGLIVGVWHRPTKQYPYGQGYTAPTKVYYYPTESGTPDQACGVEGLTDDTYRDMVLQPWREANPNIFLMNNDYSCLDVRYLWGDWAEETLLQAERAVTVLGTPKAPWLDGDYYQVNIVQVLNIGLGGSGNAGFMNSALSDSRNAWMMKLILLPLAVVALMLTVWKVAKSRFWSSKQQRPEYTVIP
jgi:hypothetical protein